MNGKRLFVGPLLLALVALTVPACAATMQVVPPVPQTFEQLLAANDLVVTGTILTAVDTLRGYAGGCGFVSTVNMPVTDIRLKVNAIVYGVAEVDEDSVLTATILDQGFGSLDNKDVLVWLHRTCEDAWRLRGWMGVIEGGIVTHGNGQPIFRRPDGTWERYPIDQLISPLRNRLASSATLYSDIGSIAIGRVESIDGWTASGATYNIKPLGWVSGVGDTIPTSISFPCLPRCYPGIFRGDSLLIPLPAGFHDTKIMLSVCPSALRVKNGYCPGLGVVLPELDRSMMTIGKTRWLRSTLRRGQ